MGIISAIGNTVAENRTSLAEGKCGITPLEMFPSKFWGKIPVGEIKISTEALKEMINVEEHGITRTTLLALHAIEEAIADSQLTNTQ